MNLFELLPMRSVEIDLKARQIPGNRYRLFTPSGPVELIADSCEDEGGVVHTTWDVFQGSNYQGWMRTLEEAVWFAVSRYGKGPCDWHLLHKTLWPDEEV